MAAIETIRIKDIQTTATTAAADDYVVIDGATNKVRKGLASNLITPASHLTAPDAHLNIVRRTLAGNLVLTAADLPQQKIIPDADRDVTLPAESTAQWMFEICHGGAAYVITLKRAGGTTVASLISGSPVVVAWDGVAFGMC